MSDESNLKFCYIVSFMESRLIYFSKCPYAYFETYLDVLDI